MRKIASLDDGIRGVVTIEMNDGRRVCVPRAEYEIGGMVGILRKYGGGSEDTRRIDVMQEQGFRSSKRVKVGTVPVFFDPDRPKTRGGMYDARSGDFRREGNTIVASWTLGLGDLDSVEGFRRADGSQGDPNAMMSHVLQRMAKEAGR